MVTAFAILAMFFPLNTFDILVAGDKMIYDLINNIFFPVELCCEPNYLLLDESEVVLRFAANISFYQTQVYLGSDLWVRVSLTLDRTH